ncbi:hypothetical protein AA23498_0101 [Acetobacter nitrogenifigens DSM 23921 = NBRC 105050]|uniref:Uncharacterized protein n=1 Tax=Acetobacter nitrogenifigens DSM 23921 = NBRC 105050 TaxID=1120919 RepID=A0A511X8X2_9PROT|nr:hypothetical protein AA23498_0101 [Acetobacter nitrogenifigens DSM 23921 = NBRC 105050]GEN59384.1 hypothetical protein ANI02nite_12680 [Acetobacter nitrogenifigens DSM 23921 = NBRC 105050]
MGLLRANVPYDVICTWDPRLRAAALVVAGQLDGGVYNWESGTWADGAGT